MKYKNKLSICMMVKNEEKYLEQSLLSLQLFFDNIKTELIIVDTGSKDRTVEIAKKYTKNVYLHEWNNNFSYMRNITIKYATGEWILILDGDEVFEDVNPIIEFLSSPFSQKYNTGMITIKSITTEEDEEVTGILGMLRLFRNTKEFHYKGAIHEQPQYQNPIFETSAKVLHYGYLATDKELMELKFKRNTELLQQELEKDPENIYYWFQLSQSYSMYKDYKKSLEFILKAYKIAKKNKLNLKGRMYIYTQLAQMYYFNAKYAELEQICLEALEIEDEHIDLYYYLGKAQKYLMKNNEAIESYKKYLVVLGGYKSSEIKKGISLTKTTLESYEDVYLDLCILYQRIKKGQEALVYAKKIKKDYMFIQSIPYLVEVFVDLKRYEELKKEYSEIKSNKIAIQGAFWVALENVTINVDEKEKHKLRELFSTGECDYSLLNKIRLYPKDCQDVDQQLLDEMKSLNFEALPVFFADVIYFILNRNIDIEEILDDIWEYTFQSHMAYLANKYANISDVIIKYLENEKKDLNLNQLRFRKVLRKSVLILDSVEIEKFKYTWDRYIDEGTYYIAKVYNDMIIDNEMVYDVKNNEDGFLLFMLLAKRHEHKNELTYIKYLRKALKVYPDMKKGIEILMQRIKKENIFTSECNESDNLKENIKKNISMLLDLDKVLEAKMLMDEYFKIVPDNLEMLTLKSEIYLRMI